MNIGEIIIITDPETGEEKEMKVLYAFPGEQFNKNYVLYVDPQGDETTVYASTFDEDGNLDSIETDEEWDFVEAELDKFAEVEEELANED